MTAYPNDQGNPAAATPVRLVNAAGTAFINPGSGGGGVSGTPLGYQQIPTTASLVTLTIPTGATTALIITEGDACRWRDDGTNPTASIGMPMFSSVNNVFSGDLTALAFIASSNTTAYNISYYK